MNDRELLELAAKAAGYSIHAFHSDTEAWTYVTGSELNYDGEPPIFMWCPLTDDGDAFRLAVKLGIDVRHYGGTHVCADIDGHYLTDEVDVDGDPLAATRRAITRAAASIAKESRS